MALGGMKESRSSVTHLNVPGPTLAFQNLSYVIPVTKSILSRKREEKTILQDVSGIMKPGMNAILGPTGSGKTSLLDVIAGRKNPRGLKRGQVFIDGKLVDLKSHRRSAYVVQDDILMGTLSVQENLQFSASLRLPRNTYSNAEKKQKVKAVLQELGLQDCANTKIGTDYLRGVSGGERKRCSIGMELITSPDLLFLDEPTTGLDANTANSIMRLLHQLSRNGRTVIFSIHQPRYSIFRLFDHLTLMSKGQIVFAGNAEEASNFFSNIGYTCEPFNNPLDFFLDVISGEVSQSQVDPSHALLKATGLTEDDCTEKNLLAMHYRQSHYYDQLQEELAEAVSATNRSSVTTPAKAAYATPFFHQLGVINARTVKNIIRNPQTSIGQLIVSAISAVLVGLIFFQIPNSLPEALQNRVGAFFFLVINQVFGNLSAVELFITERKLFVHENSSGYYRTSVYFFSKVFVDLLPNRIIPLFVTSAISYFMMGLKPEAGAFFLYILSLSLTSFAAVSLAFLVSASVGTFALANALIAVPFVFMMVFGGFLVNLNAMLSWLSWIKWISIFNYGMNALSIIELQGSVYYNNATEFIGEIYLHQQGIDYSSWGLWQNELALFLLTSVFLFFAYIQLLRINRWK